MTLFYLVLKTNISDLDGTAANLDHIIAHLSHRLKVIVGCPSYIMCYQQLLQTKFKGHLLISQTIGWILTKFGRYDPYMAFFNKCSNGFSLFNAYLGQMSLKEIFKNLSV